MKNPTVFLFALCITGAFAAGPIGNYQNTPPYVPGGAAATLTSGTQVTVCTGNCQLATDSKRAQMSVVKSYLKTANGDTVLTFRDSSTDFADSTRHGLITLVKTGYTVCIKFGSGFTGTSNATSFVFGALPSFAWPLATATVSMGGVVTDSSVANRPADLQISTVGVPTARRGNLGILATTGLMSATFLGSGTKAIDAGAGGCWIAGL